MTTLSEAAQSLTPGEVVALYRLDATSVGAGVRYFCQRSEDGGPTSFGGQLYEPIDIKVEDFAAIAGGALPTPKMSIANSDLLIQSLVNEFGDLAGCTLSRVRTFARFLDGAPDEDPSVFIGPDVFRVERKSDENNSYIEWELSAALDQEDKYIPGRQFIRDICTRRYRRYDPASPDANPDGFVYSTIFPCKYTGTACFDLDGNPTTAANDQCSRRVSACRLRFPNDDGIPTSAFPGLGRTMNQ